MFIDNKYLEHIEILIYLIILYITLVYSTKQSENCENDLKNQGQDCCDELNKDNLRCETLNHGIYGNIGKCSSAPMCFVCRPNNGSVDFELFSMKDDECIYEPGNECNMLCKQRPTESTLVDYQSKPEIKISPTSSYLTNKEIRVSENEYHKRFKRQATTARTRIGKKEENENVHDWVGYLGIGITLTVVLLAMYSVIKYEMCSIGRRQKISAEDLECQRVSEHPGIFNYHKLDEDHVYLTREQGVTDTIRINDSEDQEEFYYLNTIDGGYAYLFEENGIITISRRNTLTGSDSKSDDSSVDDTVSQSTLAIGSDITAIDKSTGFTPDEISQPSVKDYLTYGFPYDDGERFKSSFTYTKISE